MNILIVDDDPDMVRLVRRILYRARPGWHVDGAEDMTGCVAALHDRHYDAALVDRHVGHPPTDYVRIRTAAPKTPIVAVTGAADYGAAEATADGVTLVSKPFHASALLAVLDCIAASQQPELPHHPV